MPNSNKLKNIIIFSIAFSGVLFCARSSQAATYYVSTTGNDSNAGTQSQPWRTIQKGVNAIAAGDTLYLRGGIYNEKIKMTTGSSSDSARKIIQNYPGETPILDGAGVDSTWGLLEIAAPYVTVDGLTFQNANGWCLRMYYGYITIQNSNFRDSTGGGIVLDAYSQNCSYNKILNNIIHNIALQGIYLYPTYSAGGSINYALIEGNTLYDNASASGGNTDMIQVGGLGGGCHYVIVRNNTFYNAYGNGVGSTIDFGGHSVDWPSFYLVETNDIYQGTRNSPDMKFTCNYKGIFRLNRVTNLPFYAYGPLAPAPFDQRVYHNTFVSNRGLQFWDTGYNDDYQSYYHKNNIFSSSGSSLSGGSPNTSHIYFNGNYFHNTNSSATWSWGGTSYGWGVSTQRFTDWQNNFSVTVSNNILDKTSALTSLFIDPANRNYNLKAHSPIIDKGVNLTTVTSAGGSGTTFTVADSHYFCDGWNLINRDTIRIGNQQRTISSINYDTNTITLTSSVSWTQGVAVNLVYFGSAPDPGAYEYTGSVPSDTTPPAPPTGLRVQ